MLAKAGPCCSLQMILSIPSLHLSVHLYLHEKIPTFFLPLTQPLAIQFTIVMYQAFTSHHFTYPVHVVFLLVVIITLTAGRQPPQTDSIIYLCLPCGVPNHAGPAISSSHFIVCLDGCPLYHLFSVLSPGGDSCVLYID